LGTIAKCGKEWIMRAAKFAAFLCGVGMMIVGATAHAQIATATRIGNPEWEPMGFSLFSAPVGTAANHLSEEVDTTVHILPEPYWAYNAVTDMVGPGAADPLPYGDDIPVGVAANHYKTGPNFTVADFSNGNGVWLGFSFVPKVDAPTGISPDSANGPIIPNSLYAIVQSGGTQRNGLDFDQRWSADFFDINFALMGKNRPTYDGYSRMPILNAEAFEFGSAASPDGNYSSSWTYLDQSGNGWTITSHYTVAVPEPTLAAAALTFCAGTCLVRRNGRGDRANSRKF
jgi:hypothetical protein